MCAFVLDLDLILLLTLSVASGAAAVNPHISISPTTRTIRVTSFSGTCSGCTPNGGITEYDTYPNRGVMPYSLTANSSGSAMQPHRHEEGILVRSASRPKGESYCLRGRTLTLMRNGRVGRVSRLDVAPLCFGTVILLAAFPASTPSISSTSETALMQTGLTHTQFDGVEI